MLAIEICSKCKGTQLCTHICEMNNSHLTPVCVSQLRRLCLKNADSWEFPVGPVVRTWRFHSGAQVQSLSVKIPQATRHGQKKRRKCRFPPAQTWSVFLTLNVGLLCYLLSPTDCGISDTVQVTSRLQEALKFPS